MHARLHAKLTAPIKMWSPYIQIFLAICVKRKKKQATIALSSELAGCNELRQNRPGFCIIFKDLVYRPIYQLKSVVTCLWFAGNGCSQECTFKCVSCIISNTNLKHRSVKCFKAAKSLHSKKNSSNDYSYLRYQ